MQAAGNLWRPTEDLFEPPGTFGDPPKTFCEPQKVTRDPPKSSRKPPERPRHPPETSRRSRRASQTRNELPGCRTSRYNGARGSRKGTNLNTILRKQRPETPGWALVTLLGLGAAGLLGCAQESPHQPPVALEACELLSPQDVKDLAGWAVTGTLSSTLDGAVGRDPSRCAYSTGAYDKPRELSLQVRQHPNPERAARAFASSRTGLARLGGGQLQTIEDLGDEAAWVPGDIEQLHIRQGRFYLIITAQTGEQQLLIARQIADRVLAKLPAGPAAPKP